MAKPIKQPNGRWQIRPRFKSPVTGEWETKQRTFKTKAEASAWASHIIADADMGMTSKTVSLADYSQHWLNLYKKPFVEAWTIKRIQVDLNHAMKFFTPERPIDQINKASYQMWLNTEAEHLSHETVKTMHTSMKAMMESAIDEGIIARNPCVGARFAGVAPHEKTPKAKALSVKAYKHLLHEIVQSEDCVSKYACILLAFTGMRVGELLGLQWSKLSTNDHTILIDGQWDYKTGRGRIHLKDHTKPRTITVEQTVFQYLADYWRWQQHDNNILQMNQYVFIGFDGKPVSPTAINKFLKNACLRANVPRITTHSWRRTQATMMKLAKLDDKFIAGFLGHSVETLQKYYVIETDDLKEQNTELRQNFLTNQGII
ncbi:tyrosine-type recombinase/integrase [Furfurilactobacillus curtus]|uniref:Site-specific integrase n=1 Tax=Furfurilactobacillus curtus TaxID=1746200 RepID=A0ABQ5JK80_9LACO